MSSSAVSVSGRENRPVEMAKVLVRSLDGQKGVGLLRS